MLASRAAYEDEGGHAAVAKEILEDVALARLFRHEGKRVYFRYGGDAVCTRMYRNWAQLREGWTKNLALLFPHAQRLAVRRSVLWLASWGTLCGGFVGAAHQHFVWNPFPLLWLPVYRPIARPPF